jgi:archaemetzincin
MKFFSALYLVLCIFLDSCKDNTVAGEKSAYTKAPIVHLQPFEEVPQTMIILVKERLEEMHLPVVVMPSIPLPKSCFYAPRNRYRADSLIRYLKKRSVTDEVIMGITDNDISVTKGTVIDYGIMGLGYQPGTACVISTYRLKNKVNKHFPKLALHELGHTQGLPHCPEITCLMRDAEGKNHFDEQDGFCEKCKTFLKNKGWTFD